MKKREIIAVTILLILCAMIFAIASGRDFSLLSKKEIGKLKPEAAKLYKEALDDLDKIHYDWAAEKLHKAYKVDKNNIPLAFVLTELSIYRGEFYNGQKAADYYKIAKEAIDSINSQPKLKRAEKKKIANLKTQILDNAQVSGRNTRRAEAGKRFQKAYLEEMKTPTPTQEEGSQRSGPII